MTGEARSEDVVEMHTWSGTRHKFGPSVAAGGWRRGEWYRKALCNDSIATDARAQERRETKRCVRCFPPVPAAEIDRLAALIRTVDGSHSLGAGALAEALHERGVRVSS
jgi:hypothetical protein